MKTELPVGFLTISVLIMCVSGVLAETPSKRPAVDPKAEAVVRDLSARLKEIKYFKVEAEDTVEDVLDSGKKVQYSHIREISVSRPDKLVVKS